MTDILVIYSKDLPRLFAAPRDFCLFGNDHTREASPPTRTPHYHRNIKFNMGSATGRCRGKPPFTFTPERAERKTSLGKDWHGSCLRCEKCNKTLTPGGHAEHEGKPYCNHPCYAALFGPGGKWRSAFRFPLSVSPKIASYSELFVTDTLVLRFIHQTRTSSLRSFPCALHRIAFTSESNS